MIETLTMVKKKYTLYSDHVLIEVSIHKKDKWPIASINNTNIDRFKK